MAAELPVDVTAAVKAANNNKYGIPESATAGYAYTIKLNPNAKWENGTAINADTYIYSMKELLNPKLMNYRDRPLSALPTPLSRTKVLKTLMQSLLSTVRKSLTLTGITPSAIPTIPRLRSGPVLLRTRWLRPLSPSTRCSPSSRTLLLILGAIPRQ